MRITSVVASLVISTTIFVCVEPALVARPLTAASPPAAPFNPLLASLDRLDDLEAKVATLETALADERVVRQRVDQILAGVIIQLLDGLQHFSRVGDDIYITGANLHIVNGTGNTATTNGVGNLIVGYNEERNFPGAVNDRTGSHMLVVGKENNYSSYGGILVGLQNTTSGIFSFVTGGNFNQANGVLSSVTGGLLNTASANFSSVSGGISNEASGFYSSVSGGRENEATADASSVSGGRENSASGESSSISGGFQRMAVSIYDWVAGLPFLTGVTVTGPR